MNDMHTIKCSLKTLLRKEIDYTKFMKIIHKSNNVMLFCSHFIRSYLLFLFSNNKPIPTIDNDFIRMAFKSISKKSVGPKPKDDNLITYQNLCNYFSIFVKDICGNKVIIDDIKFDSNNMSYIYKLFASEMEISYNNNINLNFFKYVHQFVNQHFLLKNLTLPKHEIANMSPEERDNYYKIINENRKQNALIKKELVNVKEDIILDTNKSDPKYHDWIKKTKSLILPNLMDDYETHVDQLKIHNNLYLKYMLIMNNELEKNNMKLFQPICLRTSTTNRYVHFDTSALKDIFTEISKKKTNREIWNKYFLIDNKFNTSDYSFNYMISTDGIGVSVNCINNKNVEKNEQKKKAFAGASKNTKTLLKGKTEEEIKRFKDDKKTNTLHKAQSYQQIMKKLVEQKKKEFKLLSKNEQNDIKLKMKNTKNKCEYIEDAIKNKLVYEKLKKAFDEKRINVCDPGVRTLLTILGMNIPLANKSRCKIRKNKTLFSYNNRNRLAETKRLKYNKLIDNRKKSTIMNDKSIKEYESELCKYSSRTTNYKKFIEYTKLKLNLRTQLNNEHLWNDYVNKLRWFGHINRQRHEDKLLNILEKIFGSDAIFVLGDWSKRGCIKYISTPNKKMKNLLKKRFEVYLIDEFNTSKFNYKYESEGKKLKIKNKELHSVLTFKTKKEENQNINKDEHSVLTYKMSSNTECINRDYSSTLSMMNIVESLINHKKRPEKYDREQISLISSKAEKRKGNRIISSSELKSEGVHIGTGIKETIAKNMKVKKSQPLKKANQTINLNSIKTNSH